MTPRVLPLSPSSPDPDWDRLYLSFQSNDSLVESPINTDLSVTCVELNRPNNVQPELTQLMHHFSKQRHGPMLHTTIVDHHGTVILLNETVHQSIKLYW